MRYQLFDTLVGCDRRLPFPEVETREVPKHRLEQVPQLEATVDLDRLGQLDTHGCSLQYGGWLLVLRPDEGWIGYQRRVLGEFELPLFHVVERLALPLQVTLAESTTHCIHGSAVVIDGRGWLLTGETGAGKSTTAYELMHAHGASIAADETALVDVETKALRPGRPAVRLGRQSGAVPEGVEDGLVHPSREKRWFRLNAASLAGKPAPLAGIVSLTPRPDADADRGVERLRGAASMRMILEQSFDFEQAPTAWRSRRFRTASRVVQTIPTYEFSYRRSPDGQPAHVERLWECLSQRSTADADDER